WRAFWKDEVATRGTKKHRTQRMRERDESESERSLEPQRSLRFTARSRRIPPPDGFAAPGSTRPGSPDRFHRSPGGAQAVAGALRLRAHALSGATLRRGAGGLQRA